jgi:hypothetical protein
MSFCIFLDSSFLGCSVLMSVVFSFNRPVNVSPCLSFHWKVCILLFFRVHWKFVVAPNYLDILLRHFLLTLLQFNQAVCHNIKKIEFWGLVRLFICIQTIRCIIHNDAHLGKILSFCNFFRSKNKALHGYVSVIFSLNASHCYSGLTFKRWNYYFKAQNYDYFKKEIFKNSRKNMSE